MDKKTVFLRGKLDLPLKVGFPAMIYHNSDKIRTSNLIAIHQITADHILFETMNSVYIISPVQLTAPTSEAGAALIA